MEKKEENNVVLKNGEIIGIGEILNLLPHRYPFLMIDKVVSLEKGKSITAVKNTTINEPFFQGHFPGYPVMPGVLILEALAQAGGILAYKTEENDDLRDKLTYFMGIDKARFRKPILPGYSVTMIDKTAIIYPGAEIDDSTDVGPYSIIKGGVQIGKNNIIASHVVIEGNTRIGDGNKIFQFASIGSVPQDLKYKGEDTKLVIGNNNIIREYVTMNPGTVTGNGITVVGDSNLFMMHVHIAHDCIIGNRNIFANNATLAGHIEIQDYVILGGLCAIHQFVRIGESALIAGGSMVVQDIPPYLVASGDRAKIYGINRIGLERRGFTKEEIEKIKNAYKILYRSKVTVKIAIENIKKEIGMTDKIEKFTSFISASKRGITR